MKKDSKGGVVLNQISRLIRSLLVNHPSAVSFLIKSWSRVSNLSDRFRSALSRIRALLRIALWLFLKNGPLRTLKLLTRRKIVFGPFLGEVGIELLYWAPTVNFIVKRIPDSMHVTILSRGGMHDWYISRPNITYAEIYLHRTVEQLELERVRRLSETGTMKQVALTAFESDLVRDMCSDYEHFLIHPGLLQHLYGPFWRGRVGLERVLDSLDYVTPNDVQIPFDLPEDFSAVRLYERETFSLPRDLARVTQSLGLLARGHLVSLGTGQQYDDHRPLEGSLFDLPRPLSAVEDFSNLHFQTQVILRSNRLVVTHGGIAYIGILLGIDTVALETGPTRIPHFHTALALHIAKSKGCSFSILNPGWDH